MVRNWAKFWQLPSQERLGLFLTWVGLQGVALLLKTIGLRRSQSVLRGLTNWWPAANLPARLSQESGDDARFFAGQASYFVAVAARFTLIQSRCLPQSLWLWWLLHRRSMPSNIRIGVRKDANRFSAHAWVEFQGIVLNDSAAQSLRFSPFQQILKSPES